MRAAAIVGVTMLDLNYRHHEDQQETSRRWDALGGFSLISPFIVVPVFVVGYLIIEDRTTSNREAAIWMAVPCMLLTMASLAGTIRALARNRHMRAAAITALCLNSLALGLFAYAVFTS